MRKLQILVRKIASLKALDTLCIGLIFCGLIYELPASAMTAIGASFGLFDDSLFYSYRVRFALIIVAVAGLNILVNHRYMFKNVFFLLYIFFLAYMATIVWLNREMYGLETIADSESVSALSFHLPILFKYCLFFMIGLFLPRLFGYRSILLLILLVSIAMIMVYVDFETMGIDKNSYVHEKYYGNHLFIGDATSIVALISIAFFQTNKAKIIFAIVCAVTIFFIGSRTSFVVFSAAIFLYFVVSFKPQLLFVSCIFVVAAGIGLSTVDLSELEARNPRMFGVLLDYGGDRSVIGREEFAGYGWDEISESIVMGNFGGQLSSGPPGIKTAWRYYMHNVVSYWRQFGILALVIIIAFAARGITQLLKHRDKRNQSVFALYFLVGVFIGIETAFSRSFAFPYAHIFFGLTVAMNYALTSNRKQNAAAAQYYQPRSPVDTYIHVSSGRKRRRRSRNKKMRF